ncbi:hypothetical protein GN156_10075 [bacterium LRH843]|nr:hypothetical protein [bacterium LRH843]
MMTGCFYPNEQKSENRIAYPDQLQAVQQTVEQFQTDTGVLPIRTFDETTPIYQRYAIDFKQLIPRYIQQPPGTAFENGGVFQYVLVNVEESPQVKVIDLTSQQKIMEFQQKLNQYMKKHTYAPILEMVDVGLFKIDYKALNYRDEPLIKSPYHHDTYLPLLLTNAGDVIIDYRIDLNIMLQEHGSAFKEGEDIRPLLYEHSPFVPFRSVPYVIDENGEPAYAMKLLK